MSATDAPSTTRSTTSDLPQRIADTRLQSVLIAALFVGVCSSFGVLLALTCLVGWTMLAAKPPGGPVPSVWQSVAIIAAFGLVFAVGYAPVLVRTWVRGASMVTARAGARAVSSPHERRAANVVEEVAIAAGAPVPAVAIIDDAALNCMTAGSKPTDATIAVTTGLLGALDRQELQAVAAHELAHIINGDLRFNTFLAANSSRFGEFSDAVRYHAYTDHRWLVVLLPAARTAGWLTGITSLAASRKREVLADYTAVLLTRDPAALISALRKLADSPERMASAHRDLVNLYIVDPADPAGERNRRRNAHPSVARRIEALERLR